MSGAKKFGTFGGVFTPSILTILGVIMYMRLGWVVGNAGLYGTIIIIVVAHVISVTTGLSISSIATDKKVGAGGVYYVLSRSLGLPIGGAIGVTLFAGTALSIALYLIGFAESFNAFVGLDTTINGLRISGSVALGALLTIALISTSIAIKAQFFIMGAIILSLVSILAGTWELAPISVPSFATEGSVPMTTVFAIFFPAVTGFTAGIAMSGDLKNPKKSIPAGTIAAIVVGFVVYVGMAIFTAYAVNPEALRTDYNIYMSIALFAPAVVAGIWGATLSSALGGILGGPRILQAMSVDKITPKLFGKGYGKDNEPRNALIITFIIAECGILIGELDLIARIVSMFYLAAYGFINLSFFLESWASADFSPSFKVKRWVGLVGFLATFIVMFQLDMVAMLAAFFIIGGIYAYLQRKELSLRSGDIWNSVWSSLVLTGLKRMDKSEDHNSSWIPNILLFSGTVETRPYLIEIAKAISGKVGMISNFHLIENPEAQILFPKHKQSIQDPFLIKEGIFGRQQEVKNIYQGIETIASTYGFSGIEPNTVLLGWAKNTSDPLEFTRMTQRLIELDYNVLYLDYDWNKKFGKHEKIDVWWRNLKNNAELTLNIVKFISASPEWENASIRVILINNTNKEGFERIIHQQLDHYRIDATIKVINNHLENRTSFDLMKNNSQTADLIIAGIPDIPEGEAGEFVGNTTEMFGVLGTTLLVKTSTILGEDDSQQTHPEHRISQGGIAAPTDQLVAQEKSSVPEFQKIISSTELQIEELATSLASNEIASFQNNYTSFANECSKAATDLVNVVKSENDQSQNGKLLKIKEEQKKLLKVYLSNIKHFMGEDIPYLQEKIDGVQEKYNELISQILENLPSKIATENKKFRLSGKAKRQMAFEYQQSLRTINHNIGQTATQLNEIIKTQLSQSLQCLTIGDEIGEETIGLFMRTFDEFIDEIKRKITELNINIHNNLRRQVNHLVLKFEDPSAYKSEVASSFNKREMKDLVQSNRDYHNHWQKNQNLLLTQVTTDLKLRLINFTIEQVGEHIRIEIDKSIIQPTALRLEEAAEWLKGGEYNTTNIPEINQNLTYDDRNVEELMNTVGSSGEILPDLLELIEPDLMQDMGDHQDKEIETVPIDSKSTYNYLTLKTLQRPLQKLLLNAYQGSMEILSKIQYDLNLIGQKSSHMEAADDKDQVESLVRNTSGDIEKFQHQLSVHRTSIQEKRDDIIHATFSALNTASLIEHSVRVMPADTSGRRGDIFRKWMGTAGHHITTVVDKYAGLTAFGGNYDISGNDQSHELEGVDTHYELKQFANQLFLPEEIDSAIPFYYKQLFVGAPAPSRDQLLHRESELKQALSMLRSPNQDEHSVIVLGDPRSGKSLFSEVVAREVNQGNIIKIQPPLSGTTDSSVFNNILNAQIKSHRTNVFTLEDLPDGTIILLEDLELWWRRSQSGGKLIEAIVKLIDQYQFRFSFIINCNVYAYRIMESQGLLTFLSASRIYLSRFNQTQLQDVLLSRHETSGLKLTLEGKAQELISNKNMRKLMNKYARNSDGVVGIALHQWISNISGIKGDVLEIDFPKGLSLPPMIDNDLLVILAQFLIHKHLDESRLQKLFSYPNRDHAALIIRQLHADGIIENLVGSTNTYQIKPLLQIWIINHARKFNLI
ncbi:MAG: amino acid permease [Bacteroidetes bacterium]|nr:amino acid permease [Bacteroidota bacterium]